MRFLTVLALAAATLAHAEVRLPNVLSDHAVLQRDKPVRIWGWAAPQEKVTVKFHLQTVTAEADSVGEWQAYLMPEHAGGPFTLSVTGDSSSAVMERTDLLLGDVWIASGQSNMEMPLKGFNAETQIKDGQKEIAAANHPRIRLLLQKKATSSVPLPESADTWAVCTPETAANFSAVAYFFGREISEKENVPIGLIDTSWGGTAAHSWISISGLAENNLVSVDQDAATIAREQGRADHIKAQYQREDEAMRAAGKPLNQHPSVPGDHGGSYTPGTLFNAMIAPYVRYTIKGAIWYQGESDSAPSRSPYYHRVFSSLISDWRKQWAQGDFPFLYVQISSYTADNEGWGRVREAQRETLSLVNTGMAVSVDVGLEKNIHPPDKQTVAARLAANALGIAYGSKAEHASPDFLQTSTENASIRIWMQHAEGLTTRSQPLGGFEVAGDDRKFVAATGRIEKIGVVNTIVLAAPSVAMPKYARYAWSGVVSSYVYNAAGFPMGTFTSE